MFKRNRLMLCVCIWDMSTTSVMLWCLFISVDTCDKKSVSTFGCNCYVFLCCVVALCVEDPLNLEHLFATLGNSGLHLPMVSQHKPKHVIATTT